MSLITLITDFGEKDWYAGALKGAILKASGTVQLVDISHAIEPYDIVQAALVLKNTWNEFPEGTIHVVAVCCAYDAAPRFVALQHNGHYFLAPDNGILTLMLGDIPVEHTRLLNTDDTGAHFAVKPLFAKACGHLASGKVFEDLGIVSETPLLKRISLRPVTSSNQMRGTVIHIDHFDNVVLNIERSFFEEMRKNRSFSLYFRRNDPITTLSNNYSDVPMGEPLCLFNNADLLEIAINFGRAASLMGLKKEDVVEIIFED